MSEFCSKVRHLPYEHMYLPNKTLTQVQNRKSIKEPDPGVDVMVTIFCEFSQFSAEKLAFFLNTNVMIKLSFHERSERAKRANVVSGMVENLCIKKFSPARIGVGGCRLSVRPSVCPSTLLCRITFEPVELSC
jgi:hypothetical protein